MLWGEEMTKVRAVEQSLITISPGDYQRLCDEYLKLKLKNTKIVTLGTRDGSSKTTKGTPDSFFDLGENKYIFAQYGSNEQNPISKIESDIKKCIDYAESFKMVNSIEKIICANASSNIQPHQYDDLIKKYKDYNIEILTTNEMAHDIVYKYPHLSEEFLGIKVGSGQIIPLKDFVRENDKKAMSASLSTTFTCREDELNSLFQMIKSSSVTILKGPAGVGKTRLVLEVLEKFNNKIVICIRENGNSIFDDLPFLFEEKDSYVLFIDDINDTSHMNLKNIVNYVIQNDLNEKVKIVATARDYVYSNAYELISEYIDDVSTMTIESFSNEDLTEIISTNFPIQNHLFTNQIVRMSRGNPRLAILIANIGRDGGFNRETSIYDVFKIYYKNIIKNNELSRDEEKSIFLIALLGKHSLKEESLALNYMLSALDLTKKVYMQNCSSLNRDELVHIFKDEIVEISDQNLRDYLLYYGLIEEKYVLISSILFHLFPKFKHQLVKVLNIITNIFKDQSAGMYIVEEVKYAWDLTEDSNQKEYLKTFATIYPSKTFAVLNEEISSVESDSSYDLLEMNTDNVNVTEEILLVISSFLSSNDSNSEENDDDQEIALNLLLKYLEKRPSLLNQVYEVLSSGNSISEYAHIHEYKTMNIIIDKVLDKCQKLNHDYYIKLFMLLSKDYLKFVFDKTDFLEGKTVTFQEIPVYDNKGQRDLRRKIYSYLGELYAEELAEEIHDIIMQTRMSGITGDYNEYFSDLVEYELSLINNFIIEKWNDPDFSQCKVLRHLDYLKRKFNIHGFNVFSNYQANDNYMLYLKFIGEGIDYEDKYSYEEKLFRHEEFVASLFGKLNEDIIFLLIHTFQLASVYCKSEVYIFYEGFIALIDKSDFQVSLNLYNKLATHNLLTNGIVGSMASKLTKYSKVEQFIQGLDIEKDGLLLLEYYLNLSSEDISLDKADNLLYLIENNNDFNIPIRRFTEYNQYEKHVGKILDIYLERSLKNNYLAEYYLRCTSEDNYRALHGIIGNNYDILSSFYLLTSETFYDFNLYMFNNLVDSIGTDFILDFFNKKNINNFKSYSEVIWNKENYKEYIDKLFESYRSDYFLIDFHSKNIFCSSKDTLVIERQKNWIKSYIDNYFNDEDRIKGIFTCINNNFSVTDRIEMINYFIPKNDNIDFFKKLWLFDNNLPAQSTLTNFDRIHKQFYMDLFDSIDRTEFLNHAIYLREKITALEKHIDKLEVQEYLEDY